MTDTVDYNKPSPYSKQIRTGLIGNMILIKNYLKYRGRVSSIISHKQTNETASFSEEYSLLDVGCGSGEFLDVMSVFSPISCLQGIELDSRLVAEANTRSGKIEIFNASAELMPLDDLSINCITSFHNIEHLYSPDKFINECYRILKKDGILVLATPNLSGLPARVLKESWHAKSAPDHVSLKTPAEWNNMFKDSGFELITAKTTFLSYIPVLRKTPFELINLVLLIVLNDFSWKQGDSYHAIFRKSL